MASRAGPTGAVTRATRRPRVRADAPPHVAYVFGSGGGLQSIAQRSVSTALSHVLLEKAVHAAATAGDAGTCMVLRTRASDRGASQGRMRLEVTFAPEAVAEQQAHVTAFEAAVKELAEKGQASFWGRG